MVKLKIAVLMGGVSSEREISLKSGRAVSKALQSIGHEVTEIDVKNFAMRELDVIDADVCFIALHGSFGEDGRLQNILEARSIPFTGSSSKACAIAMDKLKSKLLFAVAGLNVPSFRILKIGRTYNEQVEEIETLGYPAVIKPRSEGSSIGVTLHHDSSNLKAGFEEAFKYSDIVVAEKFIKGREITVGILHDEALPIIELKPKGEMFDYHAKYIDHDTQYILSPVLEKAVEKRAKCDALKAHNVIGCSGFSRVDIIISDRDKKPYILEINTIPGMSERSLLPKSARIKGISFPELCNRIAESSVRKMSEATMN